MRKTLIAAVLLAYVAMLLVLTLLLFPLDHPPPNLVPFRSIARDWHDGGRGLLVNLVGNVVAFIPLGLLLPLLRPGGKAPWRVVALSLSLSGTIEASQYLSGRRVADVDDLLLNAAGGLLGYAALVGARGLAAVRPRPRVIDP